MQAHDARAEIDPAFAAEREARLNKTSGRTET